MKRDNRYIAAVSGGGRRTPATLRGFTLIEVLTVVAIIAVLIAVLFPALAKARQQCRSTACLAQLKQIAGAWQMYLDANRDLFLKGTNSHSNYGGKQVASSAFSGRKPLNAHLRLEPISADARVFFCPSDSGGHDARPTVYDYYGNSYFANDLLIGPVTLATKAGAPDMRLKLKLNKRIPTRRQHTWNESRILLLGDFGWYHTQNPESDVEVAWHHPSPYHNVAFLDAHADRTLIHKGCYSTPQYILVPYPDLQQDAMKSQAGIDCR